MEVQVGEVTHYYGHIGVAIVHVESGELKVGDTIHVKGHTTDFTQAVKSMQLEHESVEEAKVGQSVGIKVKEHAREHDVVTKVAPD